MQLSKHIKLAFAAAGLFAGSVTASPPEALWVDVAVTFDESFGASGTFTATGAISDQGTLSDTPTFVGRAIHVTRLLNTSGGEYITIQINANSGRGKSEPDWCPAPPPVPETTQRFRTGNWTIVSGTGPYATLQGTGAWATRVTFTLDGLPLSAKECLSGQAHYL